MPYSQKERSSDIQSKGGVHVDLCQIKMTCEILQLVGSSSRSSVEIETRLQGILALFDVIERGELLSALPDCPVALGYHKAGLKIFELIETEIRELSDELMALNRPSAKHESKEL